ncbi:MAG: hypothetical protein KC656_01005 [Myxococcales bacterium]|nr:hypothetical protein [Myxococcales bacterium]
MIALLLACAPCDGEVSLAGPVSAGDSSQATFLWNGEEVAGCGLYWEVDGIPGGDSTVGTVDTCGIYTAPDVAPAAPVRLLVATDPPGTCADCCPHASVSITVAP